MDITKRMFNRDGKNFFGLDGIIDSDVRCSQSATKKTLFFTLKMIEHVRSSSGKISKNANGSYREFTSFILVNYVLDDAIIRLHQFKKGDYVIVHGFLNSLSKSIIDNKCIFRKMSAYSLTNVTNSIAS